MRVVSCNEIRHYQGHMRWVIWASRTYKKKAPNLTVGSFKLTDSNVAVLAGMHSTIKGKGVTTVFANWQLSLIEAHPDKI